MSGIGLVGSIAKDALAAQRHGMDVTAHNIANVNTVGYSRQSLTLRAKDPAPMAGLLFGRGVDATMVTRVSDQLIENQLMDQQSQMLSFSEMENYMRALEGMFSESSGSNVGAMLAGFWNLWHEVSNNPTGMSERTGLYENTILLTEQLSALTAGMGRLETDLTRAVTTGMERINLLTDQIARVNTQIVKSESGTVANDLRDQRNALISELSGYIEPTGLSRPTA